MVYVSSHLYSPFSVDIEFVQKRISPFLRQSEQTGTVPLPMKTVKSHGSVRTARYHKRQQAHPLLMEDNFDNSAITTESKPILPPPSPPITFHPHPLISQVQNNVETSEQATELHPESISLYHPSIVTVHQAVSPSNASLSTSTHPMTLNTTSNNTTTIDEPIITSNPTQPQFENETIYCYSSLECPNNHFCKKYGTDVCDGPQHSTQLSAHDDGSHSLIPGRCIPLPTIRDCLSKPYHTVVCAYPLIFLIS